MVSIKLLKSKYQTAFVHCIQWFEHVSAIILKNITNLTQTFH